MILELKKSYTRTLINNLIVMSFIHLFQGVWSPVITIFQGAWSPVSLEFLNDLWIPNVFIYNLKSFHSIEVLKRLAGESISRLLWSWYYNYIPMLMIPAEQLWVPVIKTCCSIVSCIDANNKIDSVTISPQFVPKIFWNTIKCSKIIFFLYLKVSG